MRQHSLDRAAREYAGYWTNKEGGFVEALSSTRESERLEALRRAAGYFRVARNMPLAFDVNRGIPRLRPALRLLESAAFRNVAADTLTTAIAGLRRQLRTAYGGRDLLSAASKLLWLWHRSVVIIYDSQARVALGAPDGDYSEYVELWLSAYADHKDGVSRACSTLPRDLRDAGQGSPAPQDQEWFRRRVFDIHLWRLGAPSSRS
jgi:hypothetical protein